MRIDARGSSRSRLGRSSSTEELEPPHQADEARVATEHLEVRILAKPLPVAVSKLERALERRERRINHPQDRVAACKVVPGNRVVGDEPDQPAVELEGPGVLADRGEVVRLDPDRLDEEGIAFQDATQEFDLEVALSLLAKRSRRELGRRAFRGRVACPIKG